MARRVSRKIPIRTLVSLSLLLAAGAAAQQNGRVRAGEEPPQPLRGEVHAIADGARIRSFRELCGRVDAIVEGVVGKRFFAH